jgi:hypothetical protein
VAGVKAFALLAATVLVGGAAQAAPLPECGVVEGYSQEGPARVFVPDDLFDYMNGNAEGYIAYRFVRMDGITCRSGETAVVIDVSEMADPEYAFGIFSANRDLRQPLEAIGMGGQTTPRRAVFAKDKYYVELSAQKHADLSDTLRAYARAIEQRIEGRHTPPDALAWFPLEGLVADSVRLVPQSVLGVRQLESGYAARYDFGQAFVVTEASPEAAEALLLRLQERWEKQEDLELADAAFTATDRYLDRLVVFRKGARVAGFAKLAEGIDAAAKARALAKSLP